MAETPPQPPQEPARKRGILFRLAGWLLLLLLTLIAGAGGFAVWATQSGGGQAWLMRTLNALLEPKNPGDLEFKITSLSGSPPFSFRLGLTASDVKGVWLTAPDNSFRLEWREMPGTIHVSELKLINVDVARLPALPKSPAPQTPESPFTVADLRALLAQAADFLKDRHWWLPNLKLDGIAVENALLPEEMLPQAEAEQRIRLAAQLHGQFIKDTNTASLRLAAQAANATEKPVNLGAVAFDGAKLAIDLAGGRAPDGVDAGAKLELAVAEPRLPAHSVPPDYLGKTALLHLDINASAAVGEKPQLRLAIAGPELRAGQLGLQTRASWQSGPGWQKNEIDGPLTFSLTASVNPAAGDSPLAILGAPLTLNASLAGNLPAIQASVQADCAEVASAGHTVRDLRLALNSAELDIPLNERAIQALANENQIETSLDALLDDTPLGLRGELFAQLIGSQADPGIWRAGMRGLTLNALGIHCQGEVAALLLPDASPALDGNLNLAVASWDAISRFVPGQKLSGALRANVALASGLANNPAAKIPGDGVNGSPAQTLDARIEAQRLDMRPAAGGEGYGLGSLNAEAHAEDPFKEFKFHAAATAESIKAAGLTLNAKIGTDGALGGPITASLEAGGSASAKLAAQWQPGAVSLKTLDLAINSGALIKNQGKGGKLAIALLRPANITYGEAGVAVDALDVKLTPAGRLLARGGVSASKLDFSLKLEKLDFKPWQAIVPQIPAGSCAISANLLGSPQRPSGKFQINLANVAIPGSPLAPVSANLTGAIENAGANSFLGARLEIDPGTLKTLGASAASVAAKIPLTFAADGIPRLNMQGQLGAAIRWDGALGPIWNLLPLADQRLNGRIGINLDASGSLQAPRIKGGVKIDRGRYENLLLGVLLTDINLRLNLNDRVKPAAAGAMTGLPGAAELALSLSDGRGGSVKINGSGNLDGKNLNIKAAIDRLKPLRRRDVHVELSGSATVAGSVAAPDINGEIVINRGEVLLNNIAFTGSVTTLDITEPGAKKAPAEAGSATAQPKGAGRLNVRINMLPRFTVEGRGLASIWQARLHVGGTASDPRITGEISAVSGNFDFLGKNFALTRGQVTFAGGSLANPLLNIELTNETPDLTAHILITGPVNKMRLALTSDPSLPRDDILSRVLFGRSINDLSRLEALQLAAAVAQLAGFGSSGGGVLDLAKKTLGVDVLRIGTSASGAAGDGDEGAGGTTVEMGKYITDQLYMGVQQGMSGDSTTFIIQFELTPRTSLEVRSEQNNTWGGLNWKYNY